jgi:hypothetical protein
MTPPDPGPILAMWAGGIAAGVTVVMWWQIVKTGFLLLGLGVAILIGGAAAAAGGEWLSGAAVGLGVIAFVLRRSRLAVIPLGLAALLWVTAGIGNGGLLLGITGAVALGGVTAEMLLGHWYLVDPRLPRWALRRLGLAGLAGVIADAVIVLTSAPADPFLSPAVLVALAVTSATLLVGVLLSIRVPSYTGVMAATGLSYLAVLTSLGSVVLGRAAMGG